MSRTVFLRRGSLRGTKHFGREAASLGRIRGDAGRIHLGAGICQSGPAGGQHRGSHSDPRRSTLDDPFAAAGGPYNDAVAGQPIQLNGTGGSNHVRSASSLFGTSICNTTQTALVGALTTRPKPNEDDADAWGPSPWVTFNTPGDFQIRLMVFDDDWNGRWSHADVHVAPAQQGAPPKLGSPVPKQQSGSEPEIEDNFGSLPTEAQMPAFNATSAAIGYTQMNSIANYWGMTGGSELDDLGNWNMASGSNDLIVNAYTGSVMYVNRERHISTPATRSCCRRMQSVCRKRRAVPGRERYQHRPAGGDDRSRYRRL